MSINPRLLGWILLSLRPNQWPRDQSELKADEGWMPFAWFPEAENLQYRILRSHLNAQGWETLQAHFGVLHRIGLIRPTDREENDVNSRAPWSGWRLSNADELRGQYPGPEQGGGDDVPNGGGNWGDGGQGGGGRGGDNQGGDNQGGGTGRGGIREVLGHATLFSLPRKEFEDWVDNLF